MEQKENLTPALKTIIDLHMVLVVAMVNRLTLNLETAVERLKG
jgi:hypothetical protein